MEKQFTHYFHTKSVTETTYKGVSGLLVEGYMAVFDPRDRGGENFTLDLNDGSDTRQAIEHYFKNNPIVLFEHGQDPQIKRRALGTTIEWQIDEYGIWVKDFLPEPKHDSHISDVYNKIKAGVYRTFSIAGRWYKNASNSIYRISDVTEHSVVSVPMQGLATFSLTKTLAYSENGVDGMDIQEALGLTEQVKAGAKISKMSKAKINEAIAVLSALVADENAEIDAGEEPDMPINGAVKQEAREALNTLKGALNMATKAEKDASSINEGAPKVEIDPTQWSAIQEMISEFKSLQVEKAAEEKAKSIIAEEQETAKAAQVAQDAEATRVNALVAEKLKTMRVGQAMVFSGGTAPVYQGGRGINQNHDTKSYNFVDHGRAVLRGNTDYMQKGYSEYGWKTAVETTGSGGGFLVPVQQETELVPLLRAQSVIRNMPGINILTTNSDTTTIPKQNVGSTAYWVAEAAAITPSDLGFAMLTFNPKKVAVVVAISREMLEDSNPAIEQIVRTDITKQMSLAMDNAFIQGNGVGQPLGLLFNPAISTIAFAAGAASAGPEISAIKKATALIRNSNANPNGVIGNSRHQDYLENVKDSTGQPIYGQPGGYDYSRLPISPIGGGAGDVNQPIMGKMLGLQFGISNQLTISATSAGTGPLLFGDWRYFTIVDRVGIQIEVSKEIGFLSDVVYYKATARVDSGPTIGAAFTQVTGFPAIDIV